MPRASKYTQRKQEARAKPFVLEFDDGRDDLVIPAPDADTLMNAEESGTTRSFLRTVAGERYDELATFISDQELSSDALMELVRDMTNAWNVSATQVPEGKPR